MGDDNSDRAPITFLNNYTFTIIVQTTVLVGEEEIILLLYMRPLII